MPKIDIELAGVNKLIKFMNKKRDNISKAIQIGLKDATLHTLNEVKLSIAGRRPEPRSVDTGRFLNSVDIENNKNQTKVFSELSYADDLEFGTSKMKARRHFANTKSREKQKIRQLIEKEIKRGI